VFGQPVGISHNRIEPRVHMYEGGRRRIFRLLSGVLVPDHLSQMQRNPDDVQLGKREMIRGAHTRIRGKRSRNPVLRTSMRKMSR
jgi:hypothetical protein